MAEEESFTPSEPLAMEENFTHWSRFVEVPFGETRTIAVEQDPDSFILGTTVWDSSKTLLKFIEQHANIFQQFTSICELGAGCGGLAGISCAINNKGLSDVVMTDIAPVLPWLKQNVSANLSEKELERVQIKKYIWGKPINDLNGPFDCILCADVLYEKEYVRPLLQSILALSHRKTVIYLANERRAPHVRDEFMTLLHKYFIWKEIDRSELDAGYIKEAIEVFEMRPKKRRVPKEMEIFYSQEDNTTIEEENTKDYHPLYKKKQNLKLEDPYEKDLWEDLLA